jgi:hypothetical protein
MRTLTNDLNVSEGLGASNGGSAIRNKAAAARSAAKVGDDEHWL